ncbi:fungal-specific transcription factor domain-containing protein [Xylaria sp. CBS 124048]|nr:fungal-specific transcription factor domain-containing protein [Xylaria sp. CBS 124048]
MSEQKPCHNCRRRRLRCDRSVPACYKCTKTGQKCLGYGKLYRWVHSEHSIGPRCPSPRGALMTSAESGSLFQPKDDGVEPYGRDTFFDMGLRSQGVLNGFPIDPLLQDLNATSRHYMFYFATRLCQDLVVHDNAELGTNPFRQLIPMSQAYPSLQHIIIAVSAVHYYHTIENTASEVPGRSHRAQKALVDALHARQDATRELIAFINQKRSSDYAESEEDRSALLATILFFINFTLIDSGKDGWKNHLTAAGRLLSVHGPSKLSLLLRAGDGEPIDYKPSSPMDLTFLSAPVTVQESQVKAPCQPLTACDYVTSDTVAYSIWYCALESLVLPSSPSPGHKPETAPQPLTWDVTEVSRILSRTEDNSYHSCPAHLMSVLLQAARVTQYIKTSDCRSQDPVYMSLYMSLLQEAETFDVNGWAAGVSKHLLGMLGVVNEQERSLRRHIAATYRAAVCLYILLVAPGLPAEIRRRAQLGGQDFPSLPTFSTTEDLAATIFQELSFVPKTNPLFKYTVWPVFLSGIDAASESYREWVIERLRAMRDVCPWGIITSAMETLAKIWKLRDDAAARDITERGMLNETTEIHGTEEDSSSWLARIRGLKIDCLIV